MSFGQVLLISLLGGAVFFGVWNSRRRHAGWRAFAARHGWAFTGSGSRLELRGQHHGRAVSSWMEKPLDSDMPPFSVVRVDVSDLLPRALTLKTGKLEEGLLVWLGIRDDEMGTDAAARVIDTHGLTPQAIALLRAPPVREALLALRGQYSGFSLSEGELRLEHAGVPATADDLEVLVGPALDLAEALASESRRATERVAG